jgi:hypothetical protein
MLPALTSGSSLFLQSPIAKEENIEYFYEIATPSGGIPDLVGIVFDEQECLRRRKLNLDPVENSTEISILAATSVRHFSFTDLASRVGVSASHLRREVVPKLAEHGWLDVTNSEVHIRHSYNSLARLLVTIEAKKSNWRRALHQAMRHSASADVAYLALDSSKSRPAERNVDELSSLGVGLLKVHSGNNEVELVAHPDPVEVNYALRATLAERAWALRLRGQSGWPELPVFGSYLSEKERVS